MKSPKSFGKLKKPKFPVLVRKIQGLSMIPVLPPGTVIWASRWFRRLESGDVVIIKHSGKEKIKRIDQIEPNRLFVLGDHPDVSTDSRHFGWLNRDVVIAKLMWPRAPKVEE